MRGVLGLGCGRKIHYVVGTFRVSMRPHHQDRERDFLSELLNFALRWLHFQLSFFLTQNRPFHFFIVKVATKPSIMTVQR